MNYADWWKQHRPGSDAPIPRDERGLITPMYCSNPTEDNALHVKATLHNVDQSVVLTGDMHRLVRDGSWCKDFDCYSFWSHGGVRMTLVMCPDGMRRWATTKTAWDPTDVETASMMQWRFRRG